MTSRFYQYCKSNIKQKKIKEVSIKTAFSFLAEGKHIVSFVGAGGKSSLIDAIAKWSSNQGKKVLVTTTTHIFRPQDEFLADNKKQLNEIWKMGHWVWSESVQPVPLLVLPWHPESVQEVSQPPRPWNLRHKLQP